METAAAPAPAYDLASLGQVHAATTVERHFLEQIRVKRRQQPLECPPDQVISRTRSEPIRIGHGGTLLRQIRSPDLSASIYNILMLVISIIFSLILLT